MFQTGQKWFTQFFHHPWGAKLGKSEAGNGAGRDAHKVALRRDPGGDEKNKYPLVMTNIAIENGHL